MNLATNTLHVAGDDVELGRVCGQRPDRQLLLLRDVRAVHERVRPDILGDDRVRIQELDAFVPTSPTRYKQDDGLAMLAAKRSHSAVARAKQLASVIFLVTGTVFLDAVHQDLDGLGGGKLLLGHIHRDLQRVVAQRIDQRRHQ